MHARRPRAPRGRGGDPRQADTEARREGSGPIVEPGPAGAHGRRDAPRARSSGGHCNSCKSRGLCTRTRPTDWHHSRYSETGQTHARARRRERIAGTRASRTRGRPARAHVARAPRGRSEGGRRRRGGAPHAPEHDARTIEKSSRSWPRLATAFPTQSKETAVKRGGERRRNRGGRQLESPPLIALAHRRLLTPCPNECPDVLESSLLEQPLRSNHHLHRHAEFHRTTLCVSGPRNQ